jgi:Acetyltransferase (GNAT) domain
MSWEFLSAKDHFETARKQWDDINRSQGDHILLDSEFTSALLRHFGHDAVRLGINTDSRRPAMALVVSTHWGFWETFQPSQAPIGLIVFGYRDEAGSGLLELARSLPGYSLQLAVLQQDPDFSAFPENQNASCLEFTEYIQTGSLVLKGSFEEYWDSRSVDIKRNNARRRRKLTEQGQKLEFVVHTDRDSVGACIREFGRLESLGWKGQNGTAVAENNAQGRFYREVMETFCGRGEGVIFELLLDGKPIASELWIGRNGMHVNLKTAYDENLKQLSPGFLMKESLICRAFSEKNWRRLEFYGRVMDWHQKWIDRTRSLYHVNCYRSRWVLRARKAAHRLRAAQTSVVSLRPGRTSCSMSTYGEFSRILGGPLNLELQPLCRFPESGVR